MKFLIDSLKSLTKAERWLWIGSLVTIAVPFFLLGNSDYLTLCASLIGVTALIFTAKGNVLGQVLIVIFSVLYGIISFGCRYYGEMITYLGMTTPMAIASIFAWVRNSFGGNKAEVKVNTMGKREHILMFVLGMGVTFAFYFLLRALNTANLFFSTVSVFTSFMASYCGLRRSTLYGLWFAANDCVLIVLWVLATLGNIEYLAVTLCFAVFFVNDLYGFVSWSHREKRQRKQTECKEN